VKQLFAYTFSYIYLWSVSVAFLSVSLHETTTTKAYVTHDFLTDKSYSWGSHHWSQTTWMKVFLVNAVHQLGFNVAHSDMDVTWFADPLEYFHKQVGLKGRDF
jgi:hypothetical protein